MQHQPRLCHLRREENHMLAQAKGKLVDLHKEPVKIPYFFHSTVKPSPSFNTPTPPASAFGKGWITSQ